MDTALNGNIFTTYHTYFEATFILDDDHCCLVRENGGKRLNGFSDEATGDMRRKWTRKNEKKFKKAEIPRLDMRIQCQMSNSRAFKLQKQLDCLRRMSLSNDGDDYDDEIGNGTNLLRYLLRICFL